MRTIDARGGWAPVVAAAPQEATVPPTSADTDFYVTAGFATWRQLDEAVAPQRTAMLDNSRLAVPAWLDDDIAEWFGIAWRIWGVPDILRGHVVTAELFPMAKSLVHFAQVVYSAILAARPDMRGKIRFQLACPEQRCDARWIEWFNNDPWAGPTDVYTIFLPHPGACNHSYKISPVANAKNYRRNSFHYYMTCYEQGTNTIRHKDAPAIMYGSHAAMVFFAHRKLFDLYPTHMAEWISRMTVDNVADVVQRAETAREDLRAGLKQLMTDEGVGDIKADLATQRRYLSSHLEDVHNSMERIQELEERLLSVQSPEQMSRKIDEMVEKLEYLIPKRYKSIKVNTSGAIEALTQPIEVVSGNRCYELGTYRVMLEPRSKTIRITNTDRSKIIGDVHHPHVTANHVCFGSIQNGDKNQVVPFHTYLQNLLVKGELFGLFHQLHVFLSSWNPGSPYASITNWPSKPYEPKVITKEIDARKELPSPTPAQDAQSDDVPSAGGVPLATVGEAETVALSEL